MLVIAVVALCHSAGECDLSSAPGPYLMKAEDLLYSLQRNRSSCVDVKENYVSLLQIILHKTLFSKEK